MRKYTGLRRWGYLTLVAGLSAIAACDQGRPRGASAERGRSWVLADRPEASIGVQDGEEAEILSGVTDAMRLSDGRIVVADCNSSELRFFSPEGDHLRTIGRKGQGPGEFGFLRRIFPLRGDTFAAFDHFQMRVTKIGPDGQVLGTLGFLEAAGGGINIVGYLPGGGYIGTRSNLRRTGESIEPSFRSAVSLVLFDSTGALSDSVPRLPDTDFTAHARSMLLLQRLGRRAVMGVGEDRLFFGSQDSDGILVFDRSLKQMGSIQTVTRSEPVSSADRERFEAALEADAYRGRAFAAEYAPEMPAFGQLLEGEGNRLWVQDPERPGLYPLIWRAYDEQGGMVGRVQLPPRFFPLRFGTDWVLGVSFDELGVERVELWPFVEGAFQPLEMTQREAEPPWRSHCGAWASR